MQQSRTASFSARQEIPFILFHCHSSQPLVPFLSHMILVHVVAHTLFNIHFNMAPFPSSILRFPKLLFLWGIRIKTLRTFLFSLMPYGWPITFLSTLVRFSEDYKLWSIPSMKMQNYELVLTWYETNSPTVMASTWHTTWCFCSLIHSEVKHIYVSLNHYQ